jgi:hypothetical protein
VVLTLPNESDPLYPSRPACVAVYATMGSLESSTEILDLNRIRGWGDFRTKANQVMLDVVTAGLGWAGLGWDGLGWAGLGWAGVGWGCR